MRLAQPGLKVSRAESNATGASTDRVCATSREQLERLDGLVGVVRELEVEVLSASRVGGSEFDRAARMGNGKLGLRTGLPSGVVLDLSPIALGRGDVALLRDPPEVRGHSTNRLLLDLLGHDASQKTTSSSSIGGVEFKGTVAE